MQNSINSVQSTSSTESSTPHTHQNRRTYEKRLQRLFNTIKQFPTLETPITYPKSYIQPTPENRYPRANFHDIIYTNLTAMVPNIDVGYHSGKSPEEMMLHIELCKSYINSLTKDYMSKCNAQLDKIYETESKKNIIKNFDITRVDNLPDELKNIIFEYLLPETKIDYFLAKHPDYEANLVSLLNVKKTRLFRKEIYDKYYTSDIFGYHSKRRRCIPEDSMMARNLTRKDQFVGDINRLFMTFKNAVPITQEDHTFFKTRALKILKIMIYFGRKPVKPPKAPKPEKAPKTKATRKPRTKKTTTPTTA